MEDKKITVGIDPGTNTGLATLWEDGQKDSETTKLHRALEKLNGFISNGYTIRLNIEDPNKRKWFGENSEAKKQGAGSVKRDFAIWKEWAADNPRVQFAAYHPKDVGNITHKEAVLYYKIEKGRTSQHERDAIVLAHKRF